MEGWREGGREGRRGGGRDIYLQIESYYICVVCISMRAPDTTEVIPNGSHYRDSRYGLE